MRLDLTDMRIFLTIVERGSLTHGAEALNLALASVSERLSGMESTLGVQLLERSRRGIRTTAAGDALIRHARLILSQSEQMRGELRSYAKGIKGRIKLLSNTAALAIFLPTELRRFLKEHPDLSVDIDERTSAEIVVAITDGRADIGIVADTANLTKLQTHLIAHDQLVVVAASTHRIAGLRSVGFSDILNEEFIGLSDAALEIYLGEQASRLGRQMNYRAQFRSVANVGMLVEAGIGVAILSEASAAELHRPALAIVPLLEPWAYRQLHLCARDFSILTPQANLLLQQFIQNSGSLGNGSRPQIQL